MKDNKNVFFSDFDAEIILFYSYTFDNIDLLKRNIDIGSRVVTEEFTEHPRIKLSKFAKNLTVTVFVKSFISKNGTLLPIRFKRSFNSSLIESIS